MYVQRAFDGSPAVSAIIDMAGDSVRHFNVVDFGRCNKNQFGRFCLSEGLGEAAFSGACATEYQY